MFMAYRHDSFAGLYVKNSTICFLMYCSAYSLALMVVLRGKLRKLTINLQCVLIM